MKDGRCSLYQPINAMTHIYDRLPTDLQDKIWTLVLNAYRDDHKLITNNAYPFQYYTREMHIATISSIYRTHSGMMLYRAVREYYQDLCDRGYIVVRELNGRRTNWHEMILFPFGNAHVSAKPCFSKNTRLISTVGSDNISVIWDEHEELEDDEYPNYVSNIWYDVSEATVYRSEIPYYSTSEHDTELVYHWVQCYATDEDINYYDDDYDDDEHPLYVKIPLRVRWEQISVESLR